MMTAMTGGWTAARAHPSAPPLLVLAVLAAVDVLSGIQIAVAYGFAALVASMLTTARNTALVAVAATATALVAGVWHGNLGSREWLLRAVLCAAVGGLSVVAAGRRVRREERLQRMSVIAEAAQRAVLRAMPTAVGSVGFAARYVSASEDALVGGDLYEVAETPHGVRVIVGDVRGKGLEAVQLAASVLGAFRQAAFGTTDLTTVAERLDAVVAAQSGDEDFVTAVLAEFHDDGDVVVVNCGHHAPLLLLSDGRGRTVDTGQPTLPLGLGSTPTAASERWDAGSRLLLFTDGLVEARSPEGEFFPLDGCTSVLRSDSLDLALNRLIEQLLDHTGQRLDDDMALVLAEQRQDVRSSGPGRGDRRSVPPVGVEPTP